MVITRKIEVFVCEEDKKLRKEYLERLYDNRNVAVQVANMCASHLFVLDHSMPYLSEEDRDKITFLGVKGNKSTRKNAPYVAASEAFKGKADMGMVSCVLQNVQKMYQEDKKKGMWDKSLRSYKSNLPVPFKSDRFLNLRLEKRVNDKGNKYTIGLFSLIGIPFQMRFGRDRSGNAVIVDRILEQRKYDETNGREGSPTGYKLCTSSISIEKRMDSTTNKKKDKMFLHLCVDIPVKKVTLDKEKVVYAYLGIAYPIQCMLNEKCDDIYTENGRWINIDNAANFVYRRTQIQAARRRCQIACKYNKGGKGRKRKLQTLERYEKAEANYVDTRLHQYSRQLVNLAISHGCGIICLVNQKPREDKAKLDRDKGNDFVLRNWSYYGLKQKIAYKCKMCGIKLLVDGKESSDEEDNI